MMMASLYMIKPAVFSVFYSSKLLEFDSELQGKGSLGFRSPRQVFSVSGRRRGSNGVRVCCKLQDGDDMSNNSSGEPPESLFMKELRKRGISSTSLLDEMNRGSIEEEITEEGGQRAFSNRNSVATGLGRSFTNQREQSMALNSEGLEGLIPRGKLLLGLGGSFFLAFWPLVIGTVASFLALYLYFGPIFVHDGRDRPVSPPPYIDPYELLEDQRITK